MLAVPGADQGPHAVSRHLRSAADGVEVIDADTVDAAVVPLPAKPAVPPAASTPADVAAAAPTPADVARLASTRPGPHPARPGPVWSSTDGPAGYDAFDGEPIDQAVIEEVCDAVLNTWSTRANAADRAELARGRPIIPGDIDRALLLDLSDRARRYDLDEETRILLRQVFWDRADRADVLL